MSKQGNDTSVNIPLYQKRFFKEIYKRNITNVITLNHYRNGGVYVLLGTKWGNGNNVV